MDVYGVLAAVLYVVMGWAFFALFGAAGCWLWRNPAKPAEVILKPHGLGYGSVSRGFFRAFGAAMIVVAGIGCILVLMAVVRTLSG